MASVRDVAAYVLAKHGQMTAMKLQKLVYYSQAWSLVWDDAPLFQENIEAWANGPVVRDLYDAHSGQYNVSGILGGNPVVLTPTQTETVDIVLGHYGHRSSQWLSDLTHMERPWRKTRDDAGLKDGDRGTAIIPIGLMADYYSGL